MRWGYVAIVLALCGCDKLFSLTHIEPGGGDANTDALAIDAPSCIPKSAHDEDKDGIKDDCDGCPSVASDEADGDSDGLPDACDPNLSTSVDGDMILLASMFASTTELSTSYDTSGTGISTVAGDRLVMSSGAVVATKKVMIPTKLVAEVGVFAGSTLTDRIELGANGVNCSVSAVGCGSETTKMCVSFGPLTDVPFPASDLRRISVWQDGAQQHCEIASRTTQPVVFTLTGQIMNSVAFVKASGSASTVQLDSLVIYGEKP